MGAGMTPGIDVSHHQRDVDWTRVAAAGVRWAYVRACYGTRRDDAFLLHLQRARAAGLRVGAYQYLRRDQPASAQADWMADLLSLVGYDLPPVVDIEDGRCTTEELHTWIFRVGAATGTTPAIYGSACVLPDLIGTAHGLERHPLWVADYGRPAGAPRIPAPWSTWWIHQHSGLGTVDGIAGPVDLDVMREP
jgi:lysozyme